MPLTVFLTSGVTTDTQIQYNCKYNTFFLCHVLIVFFGEKLVVQTSNMQFVNKNNVYLNISLDVFGAVSSALMNQQRERLTSDRSSGVYHWL